MESLGFLVTLVMVGGGITWMIGGPNLAKRYFLGAARFALWTVGALLRLAGWIVTGLSKGLSDVLGSIGRDLPKLIPKGKKTK